MPEMTSGECRDAGHSSDFPFGQKFAMYTFGTPPQGAITGEQHASIRTFPRPIQSQAGANESSLKPSNFVGRYHTCANPRMTRSEIEGRVRASSQPICVPSALHATGEKFAKSGSGGSKLVGEEYYEGKSWVMYASMKEKGMNPESPQSSEVEEDQISEEDKIVELSDYTLFFDME